MNKGMLAIGIIILSLIALLLINVLTNFSTGSELDYYLVRETTDAAMGEATTANDDCGVPRLDRELFVETFLYRFISNVDHSREYDIYFYDINEVPPKVSVKVNSSTVLAFNVKDNGGQSADISTSYDAIGITPYKNDIVTEEKLTDKNSDSCKMYYNLDK
jgi:hypothetical protein